MTTFIAICVGVIAVELGITLAFLIAALITIRQAARAFETLAYRVDEQVDNVGAVMQSGWMRALQTAANLAGSFWLGRKRSD